MVWFGCTVVSAVIVYFFIPETAGLPMEEIGELFGDKVVVHLTSDGHGILETDKLGTAMNDILLNAAPVADEENVKMATHVETGHV